MSREAIILYTHLHFTQVKAHLPAYRFLLCSIDIAHDYIESHHMRYITFDSRTAYKKPLMGIILFRLIIICAAFDDRF